MTQTIEQLTARVRELEEENARLKETEQTNDTFVSRYSEAIEAVGKMLSEKRDTSALDVIKESEEN